MKQGRCQKCKNAATRDKDSRRGDRSYYTNPEYVQRAAAVREAAMLCWLCGGGARLHDPWQADHYVPRDPASPLLPAHRSCNQRRGNRHVEPHPDWVRYAALSGDPVLNILRSA